MSLEQVTTHPNALSWEETLESTPEELKSLYWLIDTSLWLWWSYLWHPWMVAVPRASSFGHLNSHFLLTLNCYTGVDDYWFLFEASFLLQLDTPVVYRKIVQTWVDRLSWQFQQFREVCWSNGAKTGIYLYDHVRSKRLTRMHHCSTPFWCTRVAIDAIWQPMHLLRTNLVADYLNRSF